MMTREAQKRIEQAKRRYGLNPGIGAVILRFADRVADSPWTLAASLLALLCCIYLIL